MERGIEYRVEESSNERNRAAFHVKCQGSAPCMQDSYKYRKRERGKYRKSRRLGNKGERWEEAAVATVVNLCGSAWRAYRKEGIKGEHRGY